jgi:hypothetical protein
MGGCAEKIGTRNRDFLRSNDRGCPFYAAFKYDLGERYEVPLSYGLALAVVRMTKSFPRQA